VSTSKMVDRLLQPSTMGFSI